MESPIRKSLHGTGKATVRALGRDAVFSELSYTYPLKLLSPKIVAPKAVAIAYVLSYGGGLISGDQIHVTLDVGAEAVLQLLTQGSTKVFPSRRIDRIRASNIRMPRECEGGDEITIQTLTASVANGGALVLLPDPVTCFSGASYSQTQTFRLEEGASLCLLDWYTSGRKSRGEEWEFDRYRSINEVWVGEKRVARDVLLLEETKDQAPSPLIRRSLKDRMAPYHCYATLLFVGPQMTDTVASFRTQSESIQQYQRTKPEELIWSFSPLEYGGIVRVAGNETESVRTWLKRMLSPIVGVVGPEAFDKTFV